MKFRYDECGKMVAMQAELQNGDIIDILGLMTSTTPDGSRQRLLYYLYNGVKTPLCYAHSPFKRMVDRSYTPVLSSPNRPLGYYVPEHVEICRLDYPIPRPNLR